MAFFDFNVETASISWRNSHVCMRFFFVFCLQLYLGKCFLIRARENKRKKKWDLIRWPDPQT